MQRRWLVFAAVLILLTGCTAPQTPPTPHPTPLIPSKLPLSDSGQPLVRVYLTEEERVEEMLIETYVARVLAGEMAGSWPMEALKAQAVLARTFVLKFVSEKESRYPGADISSDISEAQAYAEEKVSRRILDAVHETQGQVLSHQGSLPYAWFHAHSGGTTALAQEGLAYAKEEPGYTRIAPGHESAQAPDEAKAWEASFSLDEFQEACRQTGVPIPRPSSLSIAEYGPSGRAVTLLADDVTISVPNLRIALGSTRMRSTLLTRLALEKGQVVMTGKGYGHGVGMSQWGAYGLAQEGKGYQEIIQTYFQQVELVSLW